MCAMENTCVCGPRPDVLAQCSRCQLFTTNVKGEMCQPCRDIDHAVELERESVAAWHEAMAKGQRDEARVAWEEFDTYRRARCLARARAHELAAQAIRNGEHHKPNTLDPEDGKR